MSSIYGSQFKISTFGESHGRAIGVVIDGCPAGLRLTEEDIQKDLNRRKPGASKYATKRSEKDSCQILSGVFNAVTTGTPIAIVVFNEDQRSKDYSEIAETFRPGHADFSYFSKYGIRDHRGGGRSSGRETTARVAAGAVARKILNEFNIDISAYTLSLGDIEVDRSRMDISKRFDNPLVMPDNEAYIEAAKYLEKAMEDMDSVGGVCECVIKGVYPGLGEPVFNKLDAELAKAVTSIGAVKGIEFGAGFSAPKLKGSSSNDGFLFSDGKVSKYRNNAGGILGGISDGSDIIFRAAFKPTPSIAQKQKTINTSMENIEISISGRHDPVIVPRAIVVVEAMAAIVITDMLLLNANSKMEYLKKIYL